jgi:hypothetical protein
MLKVALLSAFAVLWPSLLLSEEAWKPESEQAALQLLEQARKAIGPLGRFEVRCHKSVVNDALAIDEQSFVQLYYDQSAGFLHRSQPLDCAMIRSSHWTKRGELCRIHCPRRETWLMTTSVCVVTDENRRTYESVPVPPHQPWIGSLFPDFLQIMPSWFDPTVDRTRLKSRFRIESAESTPKEFRINVWPSPDNRGWLLFDDERLTSRQTIVFDRQTLLPTIWSIAQPSGEVTFTYTRIDPNPPRRDLKIDLTGYKNESRITPATAATQRSSLPDTKTLEVGAHILLWLLF